MIWGPSIGWLRHFQPPSEAAHVDSSAVTVVVHVSIRRIEPEGFVRQARADAELRRRLAEDSQRLERATTSPLWATRLAQCLAQGLRVEDEASIFWNDAHPVRGLQLRIDEPELITALCPLDANHDFVIDPRDFSPRPRVIEDGSALTYQERMGTDSARDVMIESVAGVVVQSSMAASARPQRARGIQKLFEVYPVLHALDEMVLLMVRARRDTWGDELELGEEDYAALVSSRPGIMIHSFAQTGPISRVETELSEMFQDLYNTGAARCGLGMGMEECPKQAYDQVYGGIVYATGNLPASVERAVDRVRVRWMRTLSQLRQLDEIECDSGHWWDVWSCGESYVHEISFRYLHEFWPQLGVLEPGPRSELLLGRARPIPAPPAGSQ